MLYYNIKTDRQAGRQTETDRQTDRQTETDGDRDRDTGRQADWQTDSSQPAAVSQPSYTTEPRGKQVRALVVAFVCQACRSSAWAMPGCGWACLVCIRLKSIKFY